MREKIDELIWSILSFGRECSDEWWANQKNAGRPFIDHRRKYLYSLLKEEIKKVGNPYPLDSVEFQIFELCRDEILNKMEEK